MARSEQASISNLAIGLLVLFALATVGTLGLLVTKMRARNAPVAIEKPKPSEAPRSKKTINDDEAPVIRVAMRTPVAVEPEPVAPVAEKPAPEPAAPATPATVETPEPEKVVEVPAVKIADAQGNLVPMKSEASDELIPEITGMSYTTKKLLSNGMDPNNLGNGMSPAKKPDVKKPAVPTPPKTPTKVEPPKLVPSKVEPPKPPAPKALTPELPPLPVAGDGKIDFTKSPVYVLNDGRRIRAVISRELNGVIAVRNEAGTEIVFKKTDVKEIIRK